MTITDTANTTDKTIQDDKADYRDVCASSRTRWGRWSYKKRGNVLVHDLAKWYRVNLDDMKTSAQVLDYIFQITTKGWVDKEDVAYLIEAIRVTIDPQKNVCSFGRDRHRNRAKQK